MNTAPEGILDGVTTFHLLLADHLPSGKKSLQIRNQTCTLASIAFINCQTMHVEYPSVIGRPSPPPPPPPQNQDSISEDSKILFLSFEICWGKGVRGGGGTLGTLGVGPPTHEAVTVISARAQGGRAGAPHPAFFQLPRVGTKQGGKGKRNGGNPIGEGEGVGGGGGGRGVFLSPTMAAS